MAFTTRPDLQGTFGMVTTTHWLASAVGMKLLEAGGSAADAAVGAALVLNVVEPHLNGPFGEVPVLVWDPLSDAPRVLCGQGVAPHGATIAHYRSEGLSTIPGSGLLTCVVPGAFDAWMVLLAEYGRLSLREIMEPAVQYARAGHPLLRAASDVIAGAADMFQHHWPSSAAVWMPNGQVPNPGALFCNPDLASMWTALLKEAETATGRAAQIQAARRAFSQGFVAETLDSYLRDACVVDGTGTARRGVLSGQDMADWQATWEAPTSSSVQGWHVWKPGHWSQGPSLLMALQTLDAKGAFDAGSMSPDGIHFQVEALKTAFADRDAYLADEQTVPLDVLLSAEFARERAQAITGIASMTHVPGVIKGHEAAAASLALRLSSKDAMVDGAGSGEPTMAHLLRNEGDTVHLDVIDQWGLVISATPSGGWLQSNPVVPGLGAPLNNRAQMFWLDPASPGALAPGKRPRTTLSPSMAQAPDGTRIAFGTPGGDRQDQWQLAFLVRLMEGMSPQQAIDGPLFLTDHLEASFYPRGFRAGHLMVEPEFGHDLIENLTSRGHRIDVAAPMSIGRLTAASRRPDGLVSAAATPRLMQAYAAGR
jgi:gamma-glutamyltranspeptidase/glutathione hydrolase